MATKEEVRSFLEEFKQKMKIWDVLFRDDRGKNAQTLADLEIIPMERKKILTKIVVNDYAKGPLTDKAYKGADMWVFGKEVKEQEVYIKISLGLNGTNVICISFHVAEHKMNYPFKKT